MDALYHQIMDSNIVTDAIDKITSDIFRLSYFFLSYFLVVHSIIWFLGIEINKWNGKAKKMRKKIRHKICAHHMFWKSISKIFLAVHIWKTFLHHYLYSFFAFPLQLFSVWNEWEIKSNICLLMELEWNKEWRWRWHSHCLRRRHHTKIGVPAVMPEVSSTFRNCYCQSSCVWHKPKRCKYKTHRCMTLDRTMSIRWLVVLFNVALSFSKIIYLDLNMKKRKKENENVHTQWLHGFLLCSISFF